MATERWGIKTLDDSGYVNLHSDYSSIVYVGEMAQSTDPVRLNYLGDKAVGIGDGTKTSNYHMGYLIQYLITNINTNFLVPFYKPNFSKQQISILDVVQKDNTTWAVNLLYGGDIGAIPRVFAFAPLNAMPIPAAVAGETGLRVYDTQGSLVFTTTKKPLRPDDVLQILHPSSIKTNGRGGCGNSGGSSSCHVDFTPNVSSTYTGKATNTSTKIYHIVPSAYGGLAYSNSGDGTRGCDFYQERKYAWSYTSWASFRGSLGHEFGTQKHISDWLGDFAGAAYDYQESGCSWGGWFGALLGGLLAYFTFGASLVLSVGVALAGWALTPVQATPSLKAYSGDQTFDTNNPSNLIITDLNYYTDQGIGQLPLSFYNLTSTTTSVTEGTSVRFDVSGFNIVSGTYYWTIYNLSTDNADFASTSGFFNISGNNGSFTVNILQDNLNETEEYFIVEIRRDSTTGPILKTSSLITIPANGWVITPRAIQIYETTSTIVNVNVVNTGNISGTYYWTIDNIDTVNADFASVSGFFNMSGNSGSFTVSVVQDNPNVNESDEYFTVSVRSGSVTGPILKTSSLITIPANGWFISPGATTIYEATSTIVNVGVDNMGSISGTYYWTIDHISTTAADFTSTSGTVVIANSNGSFTINAIQDYSIEREETFTVSVRSGSVTGPILKSSNTITLIGGIRGDSYAFAVSTTRPDARFFYTPGVTEWRLENITNQNTGEYYSNVIIYYNGYIGRYENVSYYTSSLNNGRDNGYFRGFQQAGPTQDSPIPGVLRNTESWSIVRSGG
jgi:hypothetical protein